MRYQQVSVVESAPMQDETILYHEVTARFCTLNPTASLIWAALEEQQPFEALMSCLGRNYEVADSGAAADDLRAALRQLVEMGFVETVDGAGNGASSPDPAAEKGAIESLSEYVAPEIRLMDESEVLQAFQITSAGVSWWVM